MLIIQNIIHCFNESYQNGFYSMQNWYETISAFYGAFAFTILHPTWHNVVMFINDTWNVLNGKY